MIGSIFGGYLGGTNPANGGGLLPGSLQTAGGGVLTSSLVAITDKNGNASPLNISTGLVGVTSSLNVGSGTLTNNGVLTVKGSGGNITSFRDSSNLEVATVNAFGVVTAVSHSVNGGTFTSNSGNGVLYNGALTNVRLNLNTGSINVERNGNTALSAAVIFGIQSTSAGFLPPVMTSAQYAGIGSKPVGLTAYDTTNDAMTLQGAGGVISLFGNSIKTNTFAGTSGAGVWKFGRTSAMPAGIFVDNGANIQIAVQIDGNPCYIVAKSGSPF